MSHLAFMMTIGDGTAQGPEEAKAYPPPGSHENDLIKCYAGYLSDYFRWLELMKAKREARKRVDG